MSVRTKTCVISFRVSLEIKDELELEAKKNSMGLSSLVTKILAKHLEWHRFTDIGFSFTTKGFQKTVLSKIKDSDIEKMAQTTCKDSFRNAVIFMHDELNFENFLNTCDLWLDASGISFRHFKKNNVENYFISHNLGKNWSKYFSMLIQSFEDELEFSSHVILDKDYLSFELKSSK